MYPGIDREIRRRVTNSKWGDSSICIYDSIDESGGLGPRPLGGTLSMGCSCVSSVPPALYWARAALRPLITLLRLDPTVSREDGLLCSRLLAGGINGRMTLILSGTGATVPCCLLPVSLGLDLHPDPRAEHHLESRLESTFL